MSTKRLDYLDIAKAVSILCIVLGHQGIDNINRVLYTFHVPIFYIITGMFISDDNRLGEFVKKKARTLLVPYYITCVFMIVFGLVKGFIIDGYDGFMVSYVFWVYAAAYGSGIAYKDPFFVPNIGAIWFLWATFWGAVFLRLSLKMKPVLRVVFIAGLFFVGYVTAFKCWYPLSIQAGATASLYMYIGYLCRRYSSIWAKRGKIIKIIALVGASIGWLIFILNYKGFILASNSFGNGLIDVIGSLCGCYVVIQICKLLSKANRINQYLSYIGKFSLIFLCFHILELNLFPWKEIVHYLTKGNRVYDYRDLIIVPCKFALDIGVTVLASRSPRIRKLFGYKN